MKRLSPSSPEATRHKRIVRSLLRWYASCGRDLPWRRTNDPYLIVVSEVMLQQTQVDRVLKKLPPFRRRFPSLARLARSSRSEVIRQWSGLGYNARAIRLHELAKIVMHQYRGRIPRTVEQLRELPGIGPYSAHAIAAFAFGQEVAVLDTNVGRVLRRLYPRQSRSSKPWELAQRALPKGSSYAWNQALMDLGALICTSRTARCGNCPLKRLCPSAFHPSPMVESRKGEPSRDGLPHRIYRGRIVETLRNRNGQGPADVARLGALIKEPFSRHDIAWLQGLIRGLERDGLVRIVKKRGRTLVSLPR